MFFQRVAPSKLVKRVGDKLYINLCSKAPRWGFFSLAELIQAKIEPILAQQNGYFLVFTYEDMTTMTLKPSDHSMGFSLDEANEIILSI